MTESPPLPPDVADRIVAEYPAELLAVVSERLLALVEVTREPIRVARCVLYLATGDFARFERMVELARTDYRDAIVAAEYDGNDQHLRDLGPFDEAELTP